MNTFLVLNILDPDHDGLSNYLHGPQPKITNQPKAPRGKLLSCSTQLNMKFFMVVNVKMTFNIYDLGA